MSDFADRVKREQLKQKNLDRNTQRVKIKMKEKSNSQQRELELVYLL